MTPQTVKVGDAIRVPDEFFTRGGQEGTVTDVFDDGVELDFFRCFCGATRCPCYTSIEFWSFAELFREAALAASPGPSTQE